MSEQYDVMIGSASYQDGGAMEAPGRHAVREAVVDCGVER